MTQENSSSMNAIARLIQTVHQLRAPGGCPWDRAQSHQSLRPYLIEEAYEVLDVLDQIEKTDDLKNEKIKTNFQEELGDLLMQVLLHSEMASETGAFDFQDVAHFLNEKLIRRHPHVFGEKRVDSAEMAFQKWEQEKAKEKANRPDSSVLEGVPKSLPALQKASRVIEKVTKVGFQWSDLNGPLEKLEEELDEFKVEIKKHQALGPYSAETHEPVKKAIESELGDVLFSICNLAYLLKINPENSLRSTLSRFESRFRHVEKSLRKMGKSPEQSNLEEMDQFWDEAKKIERVQVWGITGGIGSGKTTAAKIFSEFGIPVIDADQIARDIRDNDRTAQAAIQERFGTTDPAQIRKVVFHDPVAKKDLEQILHPLIRIESKKRIDELASKHSVVLYEASLLIESGRYLDLSGLIVVEASHQHRVPRLEQRDKLDKGAIEAIMRSQMTDEERRKHASIIIENIGTLDDLRSKIRSILETQGWTTKLKT
jgi:tetrapyrrole methylase family protein/MazG family protein